MSRSRDDSLYNDGSYYSEGYEGEEPTFRRLYPTLVMLLGGARRF